MEDTKARAEAQSLQGQLLGRDRTGSPAAGGTARQTTGCRFRPSWRRCKIRIVGPLAVLGGQQSIFETRRQVFQSQAAVPIGKSGRRWRKRSRASGRRRVLPPGASKSSGTKRLRSRCFVSKGLERRPRLLSLERETADIEGGAARLSRRFRARAGHHESRRQRPSN